ncbi:MAG: hypothetical protein FJ288_15025, partial [Planctomycetes bacterium]|nr:hypothetical protein [Planctomycetota bacterium]
MRYVYARMPGVAAIAAALLAFQGAARAPAEVRTGGPAAGPLRVCAANPRYFADPGGRVVYLAGAHDGWELQDYAWGDAQPDKPFDWKGFLDFLVRYGHNVFRLWAVEHTKIADADADLTTPMPYERAAGRGRARDGAERFDLDRFSPAYFERMRARTVEAGQRGIYVIVMLFQGWSIENKGGKVNPWPYHPFHPDNNVNGVDGDLDGDGQGRELQAWQGERHFLTVRQRAYVRKVVDTVGDLDNVLYEISNESHGASLEWQNHMVQYIHEYEQSRPKRHPAGISVPFPLPRKGEANAALLKTAADWIAPNAEPAGGFDYRRNPAPADGAKVVLSDTDHLWGDRCKDSTWVWKTFCRGLNPLYMDKWTHERSDPDREKVRRALGRTRACAAR